MNRWNPSAFLPLPLAMTLVFFLLPAPESDGWQGTTDLKQASASREVDLSPLSWPEGELEKFDRANAEFGGEKRLATSPSGVVTGTTSSSAIRAGLEALNQGGSAADAALTTSLTQISLAQGAWVSYAGIITMMYYDAESAQVYSMNGGYNTILAEDQPLTIPSRASGRTALVPGYMAGVEAAHQRFGRLPFDQLFEPAIHYAEKGFVLNQLNGGMLSRREDVLSRLAETKKLFVSPETGEFYQEGDLFRQPELARTLRSVARDGAAYMYHGDWARKLVAAVRADGGCMSMDDLQRYRVQWTTPLRVPYGDHEIFAPGLPAQGGVHVAESLYLMKESGHREMGHYAESPEAFFWMSQFSTVFALSFLPPTTQRMMLGMETPLHERRRPEFARELWPKLQAGDFTMLQRPRQLGNNHSDAVVAIDRWGNMAAVVHTINTNAWGETGLFVEGVSIPDSAAAQRFLISQTVPGQRLPDPTEPLIVFQDGRPVAAISSIGAGLHAKTMTVLSNLIDHGQDIKTAIDAPSMHLPDFGVAGQPTQQIYAGEFSEELVKGLEDLGLRIKVLPNGPGSRGPRGYVVGATIDPESGTRAAVTTFMFNGSAIGQD